MMHPIEIREQNANLLEEVKWLLLANGCLMRAATGENPPANLARAKKLVTEAAGNLRSVATRIR